MSEMPCSVTFIMDCWWQSDFSPPVNLSLVSQERSRALVPETYCAQALQWLRCVSWRGGAAGGGGRRAGCGYERQCVHVVPIVSESMLFEDAGAAVEADQLLDPVAQGMGDLRMPSGGRSRS